MRDVGLTCYTALEQAKKANGGKSIKRGGSMIRASYRSGAGGEFYEGGQPILEEL